MNKNNLKILYEDNHLIVVEKPPGTLTQAGRLKLPVLLDQVKSYIKIEYNKPGEVFLGLVHRLDTNVGGVVCFAKTSKAASRLSKEIREHRFEKRYLAIVEGKVEDKEKKLKDYLKKDNFAKKAVITSKGIGKESILEFKKIREINNLTLLEIKLITGRFHQIRAQLANYGTPIYGDFKYGSSKNIENLALYAYYLSFKHPTKDKQVIIKHLPKLNTFSLFLENTDIII